MNDHRPGAGDQAAASGVLFEIARRRSYRLAGALLSLILAIAVAQTDLYGPEAPRDVAFVRFLNAVGQEPLTPGIPEYRGGPVGYGEVSDYQLVSPGDGTVEFGGHAAQVRLEAEGFRTVVAVEDRLLVFEDVPLRDISRGVLSLYNLDSAASLSLVTGDGTTVLADVAPGTVSGIQIAEAEVALEIRSGDEVIGTIERRLYGRGQAHSVLVLPIGSDPQVVTVSVGAEP